MDTLPDPKHQKPEDHLVDSALEQNLPAGSIPQSVLEDQPVLNADAPASITEEPAAKNHKPAKNRNIFQKSSDDIKEWQELQKNITAVSAAVSKNDRDVLENLNNYRLVISAVSFKPQKLDQEIWGLYEDIQTRTPVLTQETKRKPLYLRKKVTLQSLNDAWERVHTLQDNLLDILAKAPKSVEFYNRIHLARIRKREQELRDAEISKRTAQAKESIEKALSKLGQPEAAPESAGPLATILRVDDARDFWNSRLQEISNIESSTNLDSDEIINVYRNLESSILDAPRMADQVKDTEVMFIRLMSMHEELASYGKSIIPAEDMARFLLMMQDEVPKLWASGSWDRLRRALSEISDFVKFYDLPVRSELSLAERRKPGLTRALLAGASTLPITQITPIVRGLVSAIDSRDRYMAGHSDAVARISVQIAKKMNWEGEELEMLEIAALLHDVGKIVIPENILTKLDPLSPEDWKTIQMHPYHGAKIVKSIDTLNKISPWIYHHQERWDGSGYPDGIGNKDIPPAARIIALGEAFTVMTTDSPKRKAFSLDEAVSEISRGAGTQFDPEVAGALLQTIETGDPKLIQSK